MVEGQIVIQPSIWGDTGSVVFSKIWKNEKTKTFKFGRFELKISLIEIVKDYDIEGKLWGGM